jgi:uncharacterized BrkB/YihY/UPF0761 family membrane protein
MFGTYLLILSILIVFIFGAIITISIIDMWKKPNNKTSLVIEFWGFILALSYIITFFWKG